MFYIHVNTPNTTGFDPFGLFNINLEDIIVLTNTLTHAQFVEHVQHLVEKHRRAVEKLTETGNMSTKQ